MTGAGSAVAGLGSMAGGLAANEILSNALDRSNRISNKGVNYLQQGNEQQRQDFQPYMKAGTGALSGYQNLLAQGNTAAQPTTSQGFSYDAWKDPSTQYMIDQGSAAINASALASGNVGGGLGRALTANAQNMSKQAYQQAFQNYLAQNTQDFGQQQQIYQNQTGNYQNQLAGLGNLMGQGFNAASTTGNLGLGYGNAVNQNYLAQAAQTANIGQQRADALAGGLSGLASGVSSLF